MPQTMSVTNKGTQIIGGTFCDRANADKAVLALRELGLPAEDIQMVVQLHAGHIGGIYRDLLIERGFSHLEARHYEEQIRAGKVLVAAYGVADPAPVIDIFDEFHADFNPDGSRNIRDDVIGMTAGAVVGAAALGTVGGAVAGPAGAALGVAAGAVLGGGSGAAAGKAVEHLK